jgi:hypothetical protein
MLEKFFSEPKTLLKAIEAVAPPSPPQRRVPAPRQAAGLAEGQILNLNGE